MIRYELIFDFLEDKWKFFFSIIKYIQDSTENKSVQAISAKRCILIAYSGVPNRGAGLLIYFSFFADLTLAYLALPFYFSRGCLAACTKFQVWRANWNHKPCEFWLFYLPFMCTLPFVFCTYCSHYSHTAWQKPIFIENCCFCKWLNKK